MATIPERTGNALSSQVSNHGARLDNIEAERIPSKGPQATIAKELAGRVNVASYLPLVYIEGVTDATEAIQDAFDAAANGGTVYLPAGRFKITAGSLTIPRYSGNSGVLGSIRVVGQNGTALNDVAGDDNHGTTLFVEAPAADAPIISASLVRSLIFENINFVGVDGKGVADSVAVHLVNSNFDVRFKNCLFKGFETGVRIGGGGGADVNNDSVFFSETRFQDLVYAVRNLGTESYLTVIRDSMVMETVDVVYRSDADESGVNMNGLRLLNSTVMPIVAVVQHSSPTTHNSRDVILIDGNVIEGITTNPAIFTMDTDVASNGLGLVVTNNTINSLDGAALYDTAWRLVKYRGRGPFRFAGNRVNHPRPIFDLGFTASSANSAAAEIRGNFFTHRYSIRRAAGEAYPAIVEAANTWKYLPQRSNGATLTLTGTLDATGETFGGRLTGPVTTFNGQEIVYRNGSAIQQRYATTDTPTRVIVLSDGATGTITGVTATVENGASTATITAGSEDNRDRVFPGSFIQIGASGSLEVADVIGDTIYLQATYGGSTQTAQAVSYRAPTFKRIHEYATAAPTTGTWVRGDIAWAVNPSAGGPPGWVCTTGGSPGTWKEMANLAA